MYLVVLGAFGRTKALRNLISFSSLNAPSGARCFLTVALRRMDPGGGGLMHLVVLGAFWPPASGSGVVAPLPGAGAPPAPQAPRGAGRQRPYLTTFWRPDAKRHRRPLGCLQPPVSNEVKPKGRRSHPGLSMHPASVVGPVGLRAPVVGEREATGRECLDVPSGSGCLLTGEDVMKVAFPS